MGRRDDPDHWTNYGNDHVSSIYLAVYKRTLSQPWAETFKQKVIEQLQGTTVASMRVDYDYNYGWIPHVEYTMAVPGKVGFIKTGILKTPNVNFTLDLDAYAPKNEDVFAEVSIAIANGSVRLHGLMNIASMKNGTKGNKNRFAPWFVNQIMYSEEVQQARTEAQSRLIYQARAFLTDPERNQEYLKRQYDLGKKGVIQQLKDLKHLPLDTIKDAIREFLCIDVMDGFDDDNGE